MLKLAMTVVLMVSPASLAGGHVGGGDVILCSYAPGFPVQTHYAMIMR